MSNVANLKNDFAVKWKQDNGYLAKNLYGNLLSWEDILNILNKAIRSENPKLNLTTNNNFEIIYKDLLAMKKISRWEPNLKIESDATFFFSLFFDNDTFLEMIPESVQNKINIINKEFDILTNLNSLKISLSDKFVPYEYHDSNTIIIQLQGTNTWSLRDSITKNVSTYLLEPGDCLLFKGNVDHSLTNDAPRSSMVGNFILGSSYE